jgi:hypothetical protein
MGDLEHKADRRRLLVHPTTVSRGERSAKLLEDTALVCGVLGLLVNREGFIEVIPAASTILGLGSGFNLVLALHEACCYVSSVTQAKRHARGQRGWARAFGALTNFDRIREDALDTMNPSDQVARSWWVGF